MYQVISRAAAWKLKQTKYYTGKLCRLGHDAQRYVTNAACVQCLCDKSRNRYPNGLVRLDLAVHPDDAATVRQIVQGLNIARGLL